jgi:hypothetical protein
VGRQFVSEWLVAERGRSGTAGTLRVQENRLVALRQGFETIG